MTVYIRSGAYRTVALPGLYGPIPPYRAFPCLRTVAGGESIRVLDSELPLKNGDRLSFSRNRRQDPQRAYGE